MKLSTMHTKGKDLNKAQSVTYEITNIVESITEELLESSPRLVAEYANRNIDQGMLISAIKKIINDKNYIDVSGNDLLKDVIDYMFGYGPLQSYIDDDKVHDIIGTAEGFLVIRNGMREEIGTIFESEEKLQKFAHLIAVRCGGILNDNDPQCRVADESKRLRITITIPPRSTKGVDIRIRKHPKINYSLDKLTELGMLSEEQKKFIENLAKQKASVIFCGAGGVGKTTLLKAYIKKLKKLTSGLLAESEVEVYPENKYWSCQRIKKSNEGGKPVTLKDIVRDGLTMKIDVYVVGETVGDEAYYLLAAGDSGHPIITTLHALSAEDALPRLQSLALSKDMLETEKAIKQKIGRVINYVFYLDNFKLVECVRVLGYDSNCDKYEYEKIF